MHVQDWTLLFSFTALFQARSCVRLVLRESIPKLGPLLAEAVLQGPSVMHHDLPGALTALLDVGKITLVRLFIYLIWIYFARLATLPTVLTKSKLTH